MYGIKLAPQDKEAICESFRVKQGLEDEGKPVDDKEITLQAFLNARKQSRLKKINELISLE